MTGMEFEQFFKTAFGKSDDPDFRPFEYQCRLACGEQPTADPLQPFNDSTLQPPQADWLRSGTECKSRLINIPTGLGKTAAVVLAWLWNRVGHPDANHRATWPRRLVYCLPMRTLVEQTERNVSEWLDNLQKHKLISHDVRVEILMGGEEKTDWDLYPEHDAILIGTQDMLLSRALNRGYGMSRYRWSMHFGLLNNDCLWVLDETQLMGPGLSTACQLEAFRGSTKSQTQGYGTFGTAGSVTWYMSATSSPSHLETRDWRGIARPASFQFSVTPSERAASSGPIHQRRFAVKELELARDSTFSEPAKSKQLVAALIERHEKMLSAVVDDSTLPVRTLILCNTVDRAVSVHASLAEDKPQGCDLVLLHSRFRPPEREAQRKHLASIDRTKFSKGQIVVATQVIEAGVDLSSAILCSEIAPLASLVQRLGRLNRGGEFNHSPWKPLAMIVGLDVEPVPARETKDEAAKREGRNAARCLPYELAACESAWDSLRKLNGDASPGSVENIQDDVAGSIPRCPYSLQRHELGDFFDTDANLSLGFTDVSPFVRGLDNDTDFQVCWREPWSEDDGPPTFTPDYQRDELCSVPISKARDPKAREVLNRGWLWRGKESGWLSVRDAGIAPGMSILLPLSAGGYDNVSGWTGDKPDNKHSSHYQMRPVPPDEELLSCLANGWRSIAAHTAEVDRELRELLRALFGADNKPEAEALLTAVPWHDVGKNHHDWQQAVCAALERAGISAKEAYMPFAKFSLSESPSLMVNGEKLKGTALRKKVRELRNSFRPGVTHEVASAVAFRQAEQERLQSARDADLTSLLAEYFIMSHHGRVRKVLRDELPKHPKNEKDANTVRGISEGDALAGVAIDGRSLGCESLSIACRRMGRDANGHESYTRGVLRLLEHYGPFRLAFFEAIFRAADIRASILASEETNG
jgi:CRISPR-associated endonuclease/helicase Cas3